MKKFLCIIVLVLALSSCASQCCWCQTNNKWESYEVDCNALYSRILSDVRGISEYHQSKGATDKVEFYQSELQTIQSIYESEYFVYNGLLNVMDYIMFALSDYYSILTTTQEYYNYDKWQYAEWLGNIKVLHYVNKTTNDYNAFLLYQRILNDLMLKYTECSNNKCAECYDNLIYKCSNKYVSAKTSVKGVQQVIKYLNKKCPQYIDELRATKEYKWFKYNL
jgi:hypothetical protein